MEVYIIVRYFFDFVICFGRKLLSEVYFVVFYMDCFSLSVSKKTVSYCDR